MQHAPEGLVNTFQMMAQRERQGGEIPISYFNSKSPRGADGRMCLPPPPSWGGAFLPPQDEQQHQLSKGAGKCSTLLNKIEARIPPELPNAPKAIADGLLAIGDAEVTSADTLNTGAKATKGVDVADVFPDKIMQARQKLKAVRAQAWKEHYKQCTGVAR